MLRVGKTVESPYYAFQDRTQAGRELAKFLDPPRDRDALVLAVPRGGLLVALPVAEAMGAELRLVFVRKLPVPWSPEAGFGAIAIDGSTSINEEMLSYAGVASREIEEIKREVLAEVKRRARAYGGSDAPPDVAGRTVYVIDDGLATGYTVIAAAKMAAAGKPRKLILAVPVSPLSSLQIVEKHFDEGHCMIAQGGSMFAVGSYYTDFTDTSDSEVRRMVDDYRAAREAHHAPAKPSEP